MSRSLRRALGALLAAALVASACSDDTEGAGGGLAELAVATTTTSTTVDEPDDPPDDAPPGGGSLDWSERGGGWQEAVIEVPLDHDDPAGPTIEIALVRRPAGEPGERIGPLLLNPGGPGASGIELALLTPVLFPAEILDRFDIIGFDPRGVEASTPVTCGDGRFLDLYTAVDPVPDSPEERAGAEELIEAFATNCVEESGELLPHLSTVDTAKDMDLIRAALGDAQISYLGFSYGTFLGATYLELFPDRARAAVLDGAYSRSLSPADMAEGQAVGFERSIDAFLDWCQPERCDLAEGGADPEADLLAILDAVDAAPLPTDDEKRALTVGLAWTGVIMAMYSPGLWPILDSALVQARDEGQGSRLLALADQYNDRSRNGEYSNSSFAFTAINCMDDRPLSPEEEAELVDRVLAAAPRIGPLFVSLPSPCEHWPAESDAPTGPFSAPEAPPVLVVATTGDPATPYEWGVRLADELETATLLTVEGEGHTAYGQGRSCVDDAVDEYLLTLELPPEGTRC